MDLSEEVLGVALPSAFAKAGHRDDDEEREGWRQLSPAQRKRALKRLEAVQAWSNGVGDVAAKDAAGMAGVSLSRFYRLASDWKAERNLASLGTFANNSRRSKFDSDAINALQAAVVKVVRTNAGESVSKLVEALIAEAGIPKNTKLPGATKLREIVQAELRRVAATSDAGTAITFDCVATSLPRSDGRPHVLFACIDRGTHAILGLAIGDPARSLAGHASAAADALAKIESGDLPLPWGFRFAKAEITAGVDVDACADLATRIAEDVPGTNVQIASREKRFGRYVRELIGPRIGGIAITPTRTIAGDAMPANGDMTPWPLADADDAIRTAVAEHNRQVIVQCHSDHATPPPDLIAALRIVAQSGT